MRPNEAFEYERKVMNILQQSCEANERIEINYRVGASFVDVYTETGIAKVGIPPFSVCEIKSVWRPDTMYEMQRLLSTIKSDNKDKEVKVDNIVILCRNTDRNQTSQVPCIIVKNTDKFTLIPENKKDVHYDVYKEAQSTFLSGKNALILGAGVSMSAGLPSWDDLLTRLLGEDLLASSKEKKHISSACSHSAIIEAAYISQKLVLNEKVSLKALSEKLGKQISKIFDDIKPSSSSLIDTIATHIYQNNVMEVLTFNYDDLIEEKLDSLLFQYDIKIDGSRKISKHIPICHLHGFVPIHTRFPRIETCPIITEHQYHELYKNPYHWSNIAILHALNNYTCYFIGLSMTDPNLRRLLDYYSSEKGILDKDKEFHGHYIFIRKEPFTTTSSLKRNKQHWQIIEEMYLNWGLKVIWFDDFDQLPNLISDLGEPDSKISE